MKLRMLGKFCKLSRCNYQPMKIKYFIILKGTRNCFCILGNVEDFVVSFL